MVLLVSYFTSAWPDMMGDNLDKSFSLMGQRHQSMEFSLIAI